MIKRIFKFILKLCLFIIVGLLGLISLAFIEFVVHIVRRIIAGDNEYVVYATVWRIFTGSSNNDKVGMAVAGSIWACIFGAIPVAFLGNWIKDKRKRIRKNSCNEDKKYVSYSSSRSSSSGLWHSSYEYGKPSQSRDGGYDDVIAAAGAEEMRRITEHYGEDWSGYDAEAPQPWDTDWYNAE